MKLPELHIPTYTITLPISKTKIRFRPYLIKEQKILLMASESKDNMALVDAMLQILNNCLIDGIDLLTIPQVDVEYYFYQLRAKSQSEIITTRYKCGNIIEGEKCGFIMENDFNLTTDLEIINTDTNPIVELTDKVGIKFNYPVFEIEEIQKDIISLNTNDIIEEIVKNIDFIYDENNTYLAKEVGKEKLIEFIDTLNTEQFEKIDNFFSNLPKIIKTFNVPCGKCGYKHKIVIEDIFDFFI